MKEKLIIKNFGPIKEVDLDLGRFTILIGEQATGKSTVAKVLAVCRYFSYLMGYEFSQGKIPSLQEGLVEWGLEQYLNDNSYIEYRCKHYEVNIGAKEKYDANDRFNFTPNVKPLSKEFIELTEQLKGLKHNQNIQSNFPQIPISFFYNYVSRVMDNPLFIPIERVLQSIVTSDVSHAAGLRRFLSKYLTQAEGITRAYIAETTIEPINIKYVNANGTGYIKINDTKLQLGDAASGYQSSVPIVLAIQYCNERKNNRTFIIEEPELNLFPSAQNKLMKYLVDKTMNYGNRMLLTTHSPYTLTSVINMMYAYQVGQANEEKVSKKIDKKYWLNPEEVSCYRMLSDGTAENIIDDDGLIKAEKIDEISKVINKEFNDIMDIELGVDEAA